MSPHSCDVLIVGGGMVGLCLAHQLLERGITSGTPAAITVLDKEPELGRHSSGRNSGVLHAGYTTSPAASRRRCAWAAPGGCGPGCRSGACPSMPAAR